MIQIAALLAGWPARLGVIAAAVAALVGLRAWDISTQQAKGAAKVVEASQKQGAKANAKNDEVRRAAAAPGAAERLRRESCRDC
jgi:hypothetical protein